MIEIKKFEVNMLRENCYVVSDETKECVIIDCGAYTASEQNAIVKYIRDNELKPVHLLATHGHIDHNFGNGAIYDEFGLKVELHRNDQSLMDNMEQQEMLIFGQKVLPAPPPSVGYYFTEDDTISFGSHQFQIIETPGHSSGSVFFYCAEEKIAFSGDTLFQGSIGRTDFMGGSQFRIIMSLRSICQMDEDIRLYPGHGEETTIGYECQHNMYLDR